MLFNSSDFLFFFPIVVAIYFLMPQRRRWVFLLAASYYFYMCWKPEYIILIIISTVIDYFAARKMHEQTIKSKRRRFLIVSLLSNLGLLFSFKYFNFFNDSARAVFEQFDIFYNVPAFDVFLPVGISFYTFQTLSYTIDVYRGEREPERHFGIFALYVSFFPQLVAGPIERSTRLMPQFYQEHKFEVQRVVDGLKLMLWGFFKKLVIADRVAIMVDMIYNSPGDYTGFPLLLASYLFAFQIYCDFSGYSDIAIGAAKILGYDLMDNFRQPYFSKSISEFWKRWHISLSTWFRDYLYIPLGGNRVVKWRWYYNLFIVFLISGLWHGANWTFVVWGALHGFYLVFSIVTSGAREKIASLFMLDRVPKVHSFLKTLTTFHLVVLGWIFFRANSIGDAFYIISNIFVDFEIYLPKGFAISSMDYPLAFVSIAIMEFVHWQQRKGEMRPFLNGSPQWLRWAVYYVLVFFILTFSATGSETFIYFQF